MMFLGLFLSFALPLWCWHASVSILRWLAFCCIYSIHCFSNYFLSVCKCMVCSWVCFWFVFLSPCFIMEIFSFISRHICQTFTWLCLWCLQKSKCLVLSRVVSVYLVFYSGTYVISLFYFIFESFIQLSCFEVSIFPQFLCQNFQSWDFLEVQWLRLVSLPVQGVGKAGVSPWSGS